MLEHLGRFGQFERIASGDQGTVYSAYDPNLDDIVAIKVLNHSIHDEPEYISVLRQDARLARQLKHANVITVYDFDVDGDFAYIVMEYVPDSLDKLLRNEGPLSAARTVEIALQICGALAHAHAENVIHRDIKPPNILLTSEGRIKVTDFGIARAKDYSSKSQYEAMVGSPRYTSPEQWRGNGVDGPSDMYSLGVLMYEMLSGEPPFTATGLLPLMEQHLYEDVPPLPDRLAVPEALEKIVLRALEKEPEDRFQDVSEMAYHLRSMGSGVTLTRVKPVDSPSRDSVTHPKFWRVGRNQIVVGITLSIAVVLIFAGISNRIGIWDSFGIQTSGNVDTPPGLTPAIIGSAALAAGVPVSGPTAVQANAGVAALGGQNQTPPSIGSNFTVVAHLKPNQATHLISSDSEVSVEIVIGSVTRELTLSYEPTSANQVPPPPPGFSLSEKIFDLSVMDGVGQPIDPFTFSRPITVTISLHDQLVDEAAGLESNVVIQNYHPPDNMWIPLPTFVDFAGMTAQAQTTTLSVFALTIRNPASAISSGVSNGLAVTVTPTIALIAQLGDGQADFRSDQNSSSTPTIVPSVTSVTSVKFINSATSTARSTMTPLVAALSPTLTPSPTPSPTPTPSPSPTQIPEPPFTPTPTSTPTSTPTATPTAMPTISPTKIPTSTPAPTFTPTATSIPTPTPQLPNLKPIQPDQWDAALVVTDSSSSLLYVPPPSGTEFVVGSKVFVRWAVINDSDKAIKQPFQVGIAIDGDLNVTFPVERLDSNQIARMVNIELSLDLSGPHQFELIVDVDDRITERREGDNTFAVIVRWARPTPTITPTPTVAPTPTPTPSTITPTPTTPAASLTFLEAYKNGEGDVDGLGGTQSVTVSPDGKNLYAAGEFDTAVAVFSRDSTTGGLIFDGVHKDGVEGVDGLSGVYSLTVSPDGKHLYAASEFDAAVAVFSRNSTTGALSFVEVQKDGVEGVDGLSGAVSVTVSPDGKHVYTAGYGDNAVAVFSRNATTGGLTYVGVHKMVWKASPALPSSDQS